MANIRGLRNRHISDAERKLKGYNNLTLDQQANVLLYNAPGIDGELHDHKEQVFSPYGISKRPNLSIEVYKPPLTGFYQKREKPTCIQCGRERSALGASLCKECYRGNARKKFQELGGYVEKMLDTQVAGRYKDEWWEFEAVEPDFAPALIEKIYKIEIEQGQPFVFLEPSRPRPRKRLYRSDSSALLMFGHKPQSIPLKRRRPKQKILRGQWA